MQMTRNAIEPFSGLEDIHIKTIIERNTSRPLEYTEIVLQGPIANFRWNRAGKKTFQLEWCIIVFVAIDFSQLMSIVWFCRRLSPSDVMSISHFDEHSDVDSSQERAIAF